MVLSNINNTGYGFVYDTTIRNYMRYLGQIDIMIETFHVTILPDKKICNTD